jgi:transcriptional regulator with XRE-family HTH domain
MTPFGQLIRKLRVERGITMTALAEELEVSPAYLSALEHGHRGRPSPMLIDRICAYFGLIWDDADELRQLGRLSHARIVIATSGLDPTATELANRLARDIGQLTPRQIEQILDLLKVKPT